MYISVLSNVFFPAIVNSLEEIIEIIDYRVYLLVVDNREPINIKD